MAEPRSVLLVTKGLDIGGIERIVVDLAIALKRRGIHSEVAVVNGRRRQMLPLLEAAAITTHDLRGSDRIGFRAALRLRSLMRSGRFDVVHAHGPLPSVVARLNKGSARLVTTSHTPWHSLRRPTRLMWWATERRDDATTAVSQLVAGSLPAHARRRCIVVAHGVDTERVERALARSMTARDHHDLVAIVVASHRDAKNYPNLLRAFRHACDRGAMLRLVCIGDGPGLEAHHSLADELGIADRVSFRPPTLDVLEAMADADVLVVASDYEGQPLVVVEALALGLPIVATAVGNIPELVGPEHGIVVPARDADALAEAMARVANDPHPPRPRLAHVRDMTQVLEDLSSVYGWLATPSS